MNILAGLGLLFILKYGQILNTPRNFLTQWRFFGVLFNCAMCLGFWSGVFIGLLTCRCLTDVIVLGFTVSFLGMVADLLVEIGDELKCKLWRENEKEHK